MNLLSKVLSTMLNACTAVSTAGRGRDSSGEGEDTGQTRGYHSSSSNSGRPSILSGNSSAHQWG